MCGRYTLHAPPDQIGELFDLVAPDDLEPRYNIAPSQAVPAVSVVGTGERQVAMLAWGLLPSWAKDPKIGYRMINARSETAASKPSFRRAFKHARCLVLTDGFYEWRKEGPGKQPYYIRMRDRRPFAFAGLREHWEGSDGSVIDSCTILTTEPNELLSPIHDRMPVILERRHYDQWLDPEGNDAESLMQLLRAYEPDEMTAFPVSTLVNKPSTDVPECIAPLASLA